MIIEKTSVYLEIYLVKRSNLRQLKKVFYRREYLILSHAKTLLKKLKKKCNCVKILNFKI